MTARPVTARVRNMSGVRINATLNSFGSKRLMGCKTIMALYGGTPPRFSKQTETFEKACYRDMGRWSQELS